MVVDEPSEKPAPAPAATAGRGPCPRPPCLRLAAFASGVFDHLAKHPAHLTYDVIITRPCRAYMAGRADGGPL
ncbi:hypothetical protein GCM10010324_44520 [Streptomyces hiroshimensis]|uniref:Uncharacterized protein n=1 Tax=Streptomyces hiroshimensis TaxID=66424 RepID=A0ABQ2YVE3_9ACTN|nr:hypothetical protein GCM10010324_44520 [Streptomyces hiroshimensis]